VFTGHLNSRTVRCHAQVRQLVERLGLNLLDSSFNSFTTL
jgi:hypothetical protein